MGHESVTPAHSGEVEKNAPPPQDRFLPDRWSGKLGLILRFPKKHPLVIGAGWLNLERKEVKDVIFQSPEERRRKRAKQVRPRIEVSYEETLVSEIVRRTPTMPVIPGSSLKGAVRQVFELLTPSCDCGQDCSVAPKQPSSRAEVCPACSLFGTNGFMGRARFGEGVPGEGVYIGKRTVPEPWGCQRSEDGTLRVYDNRRDQDREGQPRQETEKTYATWGPYHCSLTLLNVSDDELGVLLASLGVGWDGPGPGLRVGGKKYHGFGAASVRLDYANERSAQLGGKPQFRVGDDAETWARALVEQSLDRIEARRETWRTLHKRISGTDADAQP